MFKILKHILQIYSDSVTVHVTASRRPDDNFLNLQRAIQIYSDSVAIHVTASRRFPAFLIDDIILKYIFLLLYSSIIR